MCFEILRAGITHSTTDTQALLQQQKHFVSDQEGGHWPWSRSRQWNEQLGQNYLKDKKAIQG